MKVSSGAIHIVLQELGFRELAQENADPMATAIAVNHIKFFVSSANIHEIVIGCKKGKTSDPSRC